MADRIKADADKAARERAASAAREIADARDQALREIYEQAADAFDQASPKKIPQAKTQRQRSARSGGAEPGTDAGGESRVAACQNCH